MAGRDQMTASSRISEKFGSLPGPARRTLRLLAIYIVLILVFVLSLTAVFALPQGRIVRNIRGSLARLKAEGPHPYIIVGNSTFRLDNYDDAHWLDIAIVTQPGGPLVNAMAMYNGRNSPQPIEVLENDLNGPRVGAVGYSYYWHGYQVFLRPALVAFNYGEIRYLNLLLAGMLVGITIIIAARVAGPLAAGVLTFALAFSGFWSVPITLNYVSDMYLMLIGSIVVLLWADRPASFRSHAVEVFFVIGMLTSFFDNLTNPMITIGIPLALALAVFAAREPARKASRDVLFALSSMVAWAVGYVASWVTKWAIGTLVLRENVFRAGINQFLFRAGATGAGPRPLDSIRWNVGDLFPLIQPKRPGGVLLLILIVAVIVVLLLLWRRPGAQIRRVLPVLTVAPLPFVYYVVASNMTLIHHWIMYRTLVVTVFSVTYVVLASIDFPRLGEKLGLGPEGHRHDERGLDSAELG